MRAILFVCTGNICRSPMAEAIARARVDAAMSFGSAGLHALDGAPATGHAVRAAAEMGADASGHRARPLTRRLIDDADEIYVMTAAQRRAVLRLSPGTADRVHLLDPQGRDVEDPFGGPYSAYRTACAQITAAIETRRPAWAL
jgi:protein-tyrosine-phosphatase